MRFEFTRDLTRSGSSDLPVRLLMALIRHRKQAVEASTGLDLENLGARVMGVMSEEYSEKVRQDTHRGLRGCFERKLATEECPFGYRTEPIVVGEDAHGHPVTEGYRLEGALFLRPRWTGECECCILVSP